MRRLIFLQNRGGITKKKEDNISHHTLRIRVKGNDRVSAVENQNGDIEEKRRGSNIRKPGSPRERW